MSVRPAVGRMIEAASKNSGIDHRYIVVPDAEENSTERFYKTETGYTNPDTEMRMREYEKWGKILSKDAVSNLFEKNNFDPKNIDKIITISCTGFFAPGLDYFLIEELGFKRDIKRINIGFMGCAAAVIGFNSVLDAINAASADDQNILLLAIELCSLHLQAEPTRDNILANLIFADGCAAALFSKSGDTKKPKLKLIGTESFLFQNSAEFMGWKIGNFGFEMMLSSELPKIILEFAAPELLNILESKGIEKNSIKYWALHPGGRAILDSLQQGLKLSDEELIPSREVLKNFGNMSSVSILFVLKEILNKNEVKKDELCCAVAFGPGLTMEVAIFKGV
jgi:predicted naringenin-chalcone synthase